MDAGDELAFQALSIDGRTQTLIRTRQRWRRHDWATEFEAGTSPTDATSAFKAMPPNINGSHITLSWNSAPGQFYTVYTSTDLSADDWQPLQPENIPADASQTNSLVHTTEESTVFYRIETSS